MITSIHAAVAARAHRSGSPFGAEAVAEIDRMLTEERARHQEPESAWRGSQGGGVHADGMTETGARHHVR